MPGGLAQANLVACSIFAALCGSSVATAAAIGAIAVPEMRARGYDMRVTTGTLAAGGTLGILIPPSIPFIIYGSTVGESVGRLFTAGIVPGVILTLAFMLFLAVQVRLRPGLVPRETVVVTWTMRLRGLLDLVPIVGTPAAAYELSRETGDRHAAYVGGLAATDPIEPAWTRLVVSALAANRLSGLLADHDQAVADAAAAGRKADYRTALGHLDGADAAIADARTMRDRLKATVDVTTLDQWLERSHAYDVALRALYDAVRRGASTEDIRRAMEKEQAAKDRLPPDTRALVLIMADIGQGGINDAAADIEQAHSDLEEALAPPVATP